MAIYTESGKLSEEESDKILKMTDKERHEYFGDNLNNGVSFHTDENGNQFARIWKGEFKEDGSYLTYDEPLEEKILIRRWSYITVEEWLQLSNDLYGKDSEIDGTPFIKPEPQVLMLRSSSKEEGRCRRWCGDLDENGAKIWIK